MAELFNDSGIYNLFQGVVIGLTFSPLRVIIIFKGPWEYSVSCGQQGAEEAIHYVWFKEAIHCWLVRIGFFAGIWQRALVSASHGI
ncbi:MAG: hypothetical protein ABFS19_05045 [Thermodesulfobacteriota bacterium]